MSCCGDLVPIKWTPELFRELPANIECGWDFLTRFDDVIPALDELKCSNTQPAICFNLVKPYGDVIERLISALLPCTNI